MTDFQKLPPECDALCAFRQCLHRGENKGTFIPGRGYTSYFEQPEYVCMTRMLHGCPTEEEGRRLRPNFDKILENFRDEIRDANCTNKVKSLMRKHLNAMELIIKQYI